MGVDGSTQPLAALHPNSLVTIFFRCPVIMKYLCELLKFLAFAFATATPTKFRNGECEVCVRVIKQFQVESKGLEQVFLFSKASHDSFQGCWKFPGLAYHQQGDTNLQCNARQGPQNGWFFLSMFLLLGNI